MTAPPRPEGGSEEGRESCRSRVRCCDREGSLAPRCLKDEGASSPLMEVGPSPAAAAFFSSLSSVLPQPEWPSEWPSSRSVFQSPQRLAVTLRFEAAGFCRAAWPLVTWGCARPPPPPPPRPPPPGDT